MNDLLRRLLYLPEQASTVAKEIDHLHFWVIGVTMFGSTIVGLVAIWFTYRYRRRSEFALTPKVKAGVPLEALFISTLLGIFVLFWVIGFQQYVRLRVPPKDSTDVYVTAKQWMWKFAYPNGRTSIATLVVPAGRPVRLVMTSRDVIHSFYVPSFRIKQDVLPGRYTTTWFEVREPGTYRIFCAEYCGFSHSRMWGDVIALPPDAWERFESGEMPEQLLPLVAAEHDDRRLATIEDVDAHQGPRGRILAGPVRSLAEQGRSAAARHGCLSCHTLDGQPHIGPSWRGAYGRPVELSDGTTVVADDSYLTRSMMDPDAQIVRGFPNVMPTFQGLLQPAETAAIVELIKSLRYPLPEPKGIAYPHPLRRDGEGGAGGEEGP